jgi:hypothetical protein
MCPKNTKKQNFSYIEELEEQLRSIYHEAVGGGEILLDDAGTRGWGGGHVRGVEVGVCPLISLSMQMCNRYVSNIMTKIHYIYLAEQSHICNIPITKVKNLWTKLVTKICYKFCRTKLIT